MRNLTATICLMITVLFGSAACAPNSGSADLKNGLTAYKSGDYATALREWEPLAKQGYADAQTFLGIMYEKGQGVPQDYKTAVKWLRLAAERGYAPAQPNLGVMYEYGLGVPQDYKIAVKWFRLAAEQGYAFAQLKLGAMYAKGQGVIRDYVYAHMWGNIAASNGVKSGAMLRDLVAKRMTPAQIAAAQKLARECVRDRCHPLPYSTSLQFTN